MVSTLCYWDLEKPHHVKYRNDPVFGHIGLGKQCRPRSGSALFAIPLHPLDQLPCSKAILFLF